MAAPLVCSTCSHTFAAQSHSLRLSFFHIAHAHLRNFTPCTSPFFTQHLLTRLTFSPLWSWFLNSRLLRLCPCESVVLRVDDHMVIATYCTRITESKSLMVISDREFLFKFQVSFQVADLVRIKPSGSLSACSFREEDQRVRV